MTQLSMQLWLMWAVLLVGALHRADAAVLSSEAAALIQQAGNAEDECVRASALKELAALPGDEALSKEARTLAAIAERWNGKSLHFYNSARKRTVPNGVLEYDFELRADSPLRPIAELYRGRMLAWELIENSKIRTNPEPRELYKSEATKSFKAAAAAFPGNRIPGSYLGKPIPWKLNCEEVESAPEWARLQREHIDRFRSIIHWWIDNRQQPDGSFGGGLSDDCEAWRWWAPILVSFDDPKIVAAQALLSTNLMTSANMVLGYGNIVTDVEHSAEDSTDSIVPLMLLQPDDPLWENLTRKLPPLMENVWTGKNERGQVQFRSYWYSATEVSPEPEYALDVIGNVVAVNPVFQLWLKTRDPELGKPLTAWLDTWVDATARAENGKPAGVIPASIRWPDGQVAGSNGQWWAPVFQGGFMAMYYIWPSVLTEMTDAMLVAHVVTGEEKYLAPLRSMAAIRLKYLKNPPADPPAPGSEAWCAARLAPPESSHNNYGALVKSLARCRALTGTREFDELIALEGAQFAVSSGKVDRRAVEQALRDSLKYLGVNFPLFTSEVRWTDRIPGRYVHFLAGSPTTEYEDYVGVTLPKYEMLYRMVSGDSNYVRFPMPAVRWRTPPEDIAAWVTEATRQSLRAELFHFGAHPRPMKAELTLLAPGRYRAALVDENGRRVGRSLATLDVIGPRSTIAFQLPAKRLCVLQVEPETAAAGGSRNREAARSPVSPGRDDAYLKNAKYGPHERNAFDLWKASSEAPAPLAVYIHGGGFYRGRKESLPSALRVGLLERGVSVMAINYRLSPEVSFPAHYLDCARAIQFARSRAAAWNIDPQRIGAAGALAGAGTALWIAFHEDLAAQDAADAVRRQSSRLKCVAVTDAQTSYDPRVIKEWIGEAAANHPMLPPFYGMAPEASNAPDTIALYEQASPINHLTGDDPPVYAYFSEDGPIPAGGKPGQSIHHVNFGIHLKRKMDAVGIPCVVRSRADDANWNEEMIAFFMGNL